MNKLDLVGIKEQGALIIEALQIIEKLSENTLADIDMENTDYDDDTIDEIKNLIMNARSIVGNKWWKNLTF